MKNKFKPHKAARVVLRIHASELPLVKAKRFAELKTAAWFILSRKQKLPNLRVMASDILDFHFDHSTVFVHSFGSRVRRRREILAFLKQDEPPTRTLWQRFRDYLQRVFRREPEIPF